MKPLVNLNRSGLAARPQPVPIVPPGSLMAFDPKARLVGASSTFLMRLFEQGYGGNARIMSPDDYLVSGNNIATYALICFSERVADTNGYAVHTLAKVIGMSQAGMVQGKVCRTCSLEILCHPGQAGRYYLGHQHDMYWDYYWSSYVTVNLTILAPKDLDRKVFFRPSYDRAMIDLDVNQQKVTRWAYLAGYGFGCQMLDDSGAPSTIYPITLKPSFGDNIQMSFKNYDAGNVNPVAIGGRPTMGLMQMGGDTWYYRGIADLFSPLFVRKVAEDNWELYWSYLLVEKDLNKPEYNAGFCYVRQGDNNDRYWFEREANYFMFEIPFSPKSIAKP